MTSVSALFSDIGEYFAAGFFELEGASTARAYCRAYRRLYENCPLMPFHPGDPLYPSKCVTADDLAVSPQYCRQFNYDPTRLMKKSPEAARIFDGFYAEHMEFWQVDTFKEAKHYFSYLDAWNHSAPNFARIAKEGLDGYRKRILLMKDEDLKEALLDVIEGIRAYRERSLAYLKSVRADEKLISALEKVPFAPVETAYEAMVMANFIFCFDGCDNIGHADSFLLPYWKGENLEKEMHFMMKSLENSVGWSLTLGPDYTELTKEWLRASKGLARPLIELRVTPDMPEDVWDLALETVLSGGGQPAFYNDKAITSRLLRRLPEAPEEDIHAFAGMGCTETSITGKTFCGGIDVNLSVLKVFEDAMKEVLEACPSFGDFYAAFLKKLHTAQDILIAFVDAYYTRRSEISFAPIRTLFTDDCIEKEKGYYQGGARYTFAIPSDSGIPNAVDSLLAVRKLVYETKAYSAADFLSALEKDDPAFRAALRSCPSYGVADPEADELMRGLTTEFYEYYLSAKLSLGVGFLPTSHQFLRHVPEGGRVGNTPDGRRAGEPVADSIAAVNGKAQKGPTSMLVSAASFIQKDIYGIPVLNLSIARKFEPSVLRALIESYFEMDGTQMQITCTTRETLLDAKAHPEAHRDLIVRVGGYSSFFNDLDDALQNAVIARTLFEG